MKEKRIEILVISLFVFLTIFVFKDYFFKARVPFPANFLVSFFQPWTSYEIENVVSGQGLAHKHLGEDNLRIFYPLRKLTIDEMKNLEWPLWNPYAFSGNTQLATYQSAVFHPLSFLFFILPQIDAWSLVIILQPFLLSIFMYLFLREIDLGRKASVFGAITFAFAGCMVVWFQEAFMPGYSGLFLPLILYAIEKMMKKISGLAFLFLVIGLSFSLLSGWFQTTFYVWLFAFIWAVFRFSSENKKRFFLLLVIVGYVLALLISLVHLIPSIEAYIYSVRGSADAKGLFYGYLLPPSHLITFIAPDFFGNAASYNYFGHNLYHEKVIFVGIVPLFFALYAMFIKTKNKSKEKFFKLAWPITLSFGLALPTSWLFLYHLKLPFISVMLPARIFFLSAFCVSVLAAFGLEKYLNENIRKKKLFFASSLIGMGLLAAWGFVMYNKSNFPESPFATISLRNLILPSGFFLSCLILAWAPVLRKRLKTYVYIGFFVVSFASIVYFANKYLYFSERHVVFPQTPVLLQLQKISGINRVWTFGRGYIQRNFFTYYRLFSPEGYDSIYVKRYGELMFAASNGGVVSPHTPRVDARIPVAEKREEILTHPYRKKLLSLLGIRYIAGIKDNEKGKEDNLKALWDDGRFVIYEFTDAYPRFFLVTDYKVLINKQAIVNAMFDPRTDLAKTIILEKDPPGISKTRTNQGEVKLDFYKTNEIAFSAFTKEPSLLFLSDSYYPGWKGYVDGKETEVYRADYSFRAVVVPQGNHKVSFRYEPLSFSLGLAGSGIGLLLLGAIVAKVGRKRK